MGTVNDAAFANKLGHFYQNMADGMGQFIHTQIGTLPKDKVVSLTDQQNQLIHYANLFFVLSDRIAFDQSDTFFKGVSDATDDIDKAVKEIKDVNKAINITAGLITLAAAIVTENGSGIVSSLQTIAGAIKS
jgi:hypothetical protein